MAVRATRVPRETHLKKEYILKTKTQQITKRKDNIMKRILLLALVVAAALTTAWYVTQPKTDKVVVAYVFRTDVPVDPSLFTLSVMSPRRSTVFASPIPKASVRW